MRMDFQEFWGRIVAYFEASGWSWVIFMAVLVAGVVLVRALCYGLRRMLLRGRMERTLAGFVVTIVRFVLYVVLVFVLAAIVNVDMSPLASAIAAALVAVGLALQDSLSNLANGVLLISTKPFVEGDYVDINGTGGTVKNIGIFVTELITPDNRKVVMNNSAVMGGTITNFSARTTRRVDFMFSVPHTVDVEHIKSVIKAAVTAHPKVLTDPEPTVRLHSIKDVQLDFVTRAWVSSGDYWEVYWDINEAVFAVLKKEGIDTRLSRVDVRLIKED